MNHPSATLSSLALLFATTMPSIAENDFRSLAIGLKPESSVYAFGGKLRVTLMGETREKGDGDGSIVVVDGDRITTLASGLYDPKGIVFIDNKLITTDFDTLWSIDENGVKTVFAGPDDFPFPPSFLNDVAIEPGGKSILVTDMGERATMMNPDGEFWPLDSEEAKNIDPKGRIYRITLDGKVSIALDHSPEAPNPNGVDILADGTVLIAEFFRGHLLAWKGGKFRQISSDHRSGDGIVHAKNGDLYLSEVRTGRVWQIKKDGSEKNLLTTLESAADLILDAERGELIVPDTKAGKLVFIPLPK